MLTIPWRFHPDRDALLAEAHARPSTPVRAPLLASRIGSLSGQDGINLDRNHMSALCRMFGVPEPGPTARWCVVEHDGWRLRWERHTELSTWTVFAPAGPASETPLQATAIDALPPGWLAELPGDVLVATHVAILETEPTTLPFDNDDLVAAELAFGLAKVFTDFRQGPDGFTRFLLAPRTDAAAVAIGRILQQILEIESYRLLALLAFPLAGEAAADLSLLEGEVTEATGHAKDAGGLESDRVMLARLAELAGRAEAVAGRTSFRFAAARAYYGIVLERILQLSEKPVLTRPTLGEFMERRLAPAMRTCSAVADRQSEVIDRLTRATQMLSTRVGVAAEATNVELLDSMDRRSRAQLRLQQSVEGLSVAAISYYALAILGYGFKAVSTLAPVINVELAIGVSAPFVILAVWRVLRRASSLTEDGKGPSQPASKGANPRDAPTDATQRGPRPDGGP